ncbi:MAG: NAD-dependent epimerase/dehydratase family protein [Dehalococcoidia bacterium]|nr:NAD-dependent epimerase/dehydratase family protein [Dehalococcoidia bacterium]
MRRIAVTGASGYLGSVLIKRLIQEPYVELILGFDVRPSTLAHSKLRHVQQEINAPMKQSLSESGVDSIVHLAFLLNTTRDRAISRRVNLDGTINVINESAAAGLSHIFFASSSTVYGAYSDNPSHLSETDAIRPNQGFTYSEDKAELERIIEKFSKENSRIAVTTARIAPVLGPNTNNFVVRAFFRSVMIKSSSCNPPLQYTHENDFSDIVTSLVLNRTGGIFNIASEGEISYTDVAMVAGKKLITIPSGILGPMTGLAWHLRLQSDGTPAGLAFIKYPWLVSIAKLKAYLGIAPHYTSVQAVSDYAARNMAVSRNAEKVY